MPRHIITVGLSFGDEGKGTIVDSLVRQYNLPVVARYSGGCQAAHNVVTPEGIHHTFSQYGSGTLAGALTFLMKDMMVDPLRLMKEGEVLQGKGIKRALAGFDGIMHIDERCLVTTPYHAALNQRKELARGNARHGSCGVGIGETTAYSLKYPASALRIGDLLNKDVMRQKLAIMAVTMKLEFDNISLHHLATPPDIYSPFTDPNFFDALCWRYMEFTNKIRIVPELQNLIKHRDCVFEASQGVLLDEDYGFHPYTTWSHVTTGNAEETLRSIGIKDYTKIGIIRAYASRHGAGPFPTENLLVTNKIQEPHNATNTWQGDFRAGWFDVPMTNYAIDATRGIDYLAVTHTDKLAKFDSFPFASAYKNFNLTAPPFDDFVAREEFTKKLISLNSNDIELKEVPISEFLLKIEKRTGVKIAITSAGQSHSDKRYLVDL